MTTTTEFQLVDINKLVPYANNARTHNKEQILKLRSSLREFGFVNPVIIDKDFNVLAGHGRIMAAKEEGITEVPCVYADHFTEAQKKAYILADNRMALDAGWDDELLAVEMEELQNLGFDLGLTGFDEKEIADLFDTNGSDDVKDDDFDLTSALEKAAFVQRGDLWTVGKHKLMCGDATSAEDVSALMGDMKANLILTDPPYGVSFKSSSGLTIQNDSMKNEEFYTFLLSAFKCMAEHLEKGGAAYVFHADTEGLNFRRAFVDAGFHLAGCCIWVKDSLVLGRSDYICAFLSYHVYYQNEMEVYYMIIELGLKGNERKELAKEVSEIIGAPAEYQYMPTCAYKIGRDYTVTKEGNLEISDSADSKEVENLIDELVSRGYDIPTAEDETTASEDKENSLTVELPLELVDDATIDRLRKIIENKGELFKAAFNTDNLDIIVDEDKVCFPWFTVEQYDDTSAYCTFISMLCEFAKNQSRINNKPDTSDNPKYTMRCYLLRLGMIGAEYKDTRKVLLRNLSGSSAFRKVSDSNEVSE